MSERDYEIDIRSIDTEYDTTLARDVGEEIDAATTVSLATITVTVQVRWRDGSNVRRDTFEIPFVADHEMAAVEARSVGDAYGAPESLSVERLLLAMRAAEQTVARLLDELPTGLTLKPVEERWPLGGVTDEPVDVVHDETTFPPREVALDD
jgi:hypothetical protein